MGSISCELAGNLNLLSHSLSRIRKKETRRIKSEEQNGKKNKGGSQLGNTALKRYNYISIKIQEWISRSGPCFLPFLRCERRKDNEEIKNHSERFRNAQLTRKFHVGLNATAVAAAAAAVASSSMISRTAA